MSKDKSLSIQHIFDKAAVGMLVQDQQAMDPSQEACAYRGANGCKCAVGFLIEDEYYSPYFEGPTVDQFGSVGITGKKTQALFDALKKSGVNVENSDIRYLLESLQEIHDDCFPGLWYSELRRLAAKLNLSTKSIDLVIEARKEVGRRSGVVDMHGPMKVNT